MMKQRYTIRKNGTEPSSEQIRGHMDFDGLMNAYRAQPDPPAEPPRGNIRRLVTFGGLAAAAAAVVAWFFALPALTSEPLNSPAEYRTILASHRAAGPYVDPPLPTLRNALQSGSVSASEGGVVTFGNGSRVVVPAVAFVDDRGAAVRGEVEVRVREMHDPVDIFLSGIPMVYDSAGVQYTLESAGMLEIFATQDGRRVRLAPGKQLEVELVSEIDVPMFDAPPGFNIYELDTTARNWVYRDVDRQQFVDDPLELLGADHPARTATETYQRELAAIAAEEAALENESDAALETAALQRAGLTEKPLEPVRSNETDFVFDLDLSNYRGDRSNLREGTLWTFAPGQNLRPQDLNKNWADVKIEPLGPTEYRLTFVAAEPLVVRARPVLTGSNYTAAVRDYETRQARYADALRAERAARAAERTERRDRMRERRRLAKARYEDSLAELRAAGDATGVTNQMIRRRVINRFAASQMGFWNCDRPLPPLMQRARVHLVNAAGERYHQLPLYFVDKTRNTVTELIADERGALLNFQRNSTAILWVVTAENQLALIRPAALRQRLNVAPSEEIVDVTLPLEIVAADLDSEDDLRRVLAL